MCPSCMLEPSHSLLAMVWGGSVKHGGDGAAAVFRLCEAQQGSNSGKEEKEEDGGGACAFCRPSPIYRVQVTKSR